MGQVAIGTDTGTGWAGRGHAVAERPVALDAPWRCDA